MSEIDLKTLQEKKSKYFDLKKKIITAVISNNKLMPCFNCKKCVCEKLLTIKHLGSLETFTECSSYEPK